MFYSKDSGDVKVGVPSITQSSILDDGIFSIDIGSLGMSRTGGLS